MIEDKKGKLKKIYEHQLRQLLSSYDHSKTKLVFINACHSEEIGKIFSEAGIPVVIAVQSNLKILDEVASQFSQ